MVSTWIPVERRWLGLDRRTLLPGFVVLFLAIALRGLLPLIDQAVPGNDVIKPGDRINLDGGLTVTPPVGWQLTDGILVGENTVQPGAGSPTASVVQKGVGAQMRVAPFSGDAEALLDQVISNDSKSGQQPQFAVTGNRGSVTATGGITGAVEDYTSTSGDGILAAYTFTDGRGLVVNVIGTGNQLAAHSAEIDAMLRSVSLQEQS
ncbi:hypothetical protein [Actinoplanes sp. GCM10030250]|uniref:hypothetical protein n=1 Tax=Actinoplanes sp. GCM10030250 TaxID=3273376 RepID=UPI003614890F